MKHEPFKYTQKYLREIQRICYVVYGWIGLNLKILSRAYMCLADAVVASWSNTRGGRFESFHCNDKYFCHWIRGKLPMTHRTTTHSITDSPWKEEIREMDKSRMFLWRHCFVLFLLSCSRSSYERYHKSYCDSNLTYYQVVLGGFSETTFDVILMTAGNQSFVIKAELLFKHPCIVFTT